MIYGVTGHRKLLSKQNILIPKVESILQDASEVHTGMAYGFDMLVAHVCYTINIPFVCHIPFRDQGKNWNRRTKEYYDFLRGKAAKEIVYFEEYNKDCFFIRDKGIVDSTQKLLAHYDGRLQGGTYYTHKYAKSLEREILYVL